MFGHSNHIILKTGSLAAIALGLVALSSSTAMANTSDSMNASGEVIQEIGINIIADLDFGTIARPSDGTATLEITPGNVATVTGGTGANHYGDSTAGQFEITGAADQSVQFSAVVGDFSDAGLTFTAALFSEDESTSILLGTEGSVSIDVGGTFDVTTAAAAQEHTDGEVVIDVWYD